MSVFCFLKVCQSLSLSLTVLELCHCIWQFNSFICVCAWEHLLRQSLVFFFSWQIWGRRSWQLCARARLLAWVDWLIDWFQALMQLQVVQVCKSGSLHKIRLGLCIFLGFWTTNLLLKVGFLFFSKKAEIFFLPSLQHCSNLWSWSWDFTLSLRFGLG